MWHFQKYRLGRIWTIGRREFKMKILTIILVTWSCDFSMRKLVPTIWIYGAQLDRVRFHIRRIYILPFLIQIFRTMTPNQFLWIEIDQKSLLERLNIQNIPWLVLIDLEVFFRFHQSPSNPASSYISRPNSTFFDLSKNHKSIPDSNAGRDGWSHQVIKNRWLSYSRNYHLIFATLPRTHWYEYKTLRKNDSQYVARLPNRVYSLRHDWTVSRASPRHRSIDQLSKMNELRNEECTLWSRFENVPACTICLLQPHRLSDCDDLLTVNKEQFERASSTLWNVEHLTRDILWRGLKLNKILEIYLWCSLDQVWQWWKCTRTDK